MKRMLVALTITAVFGNLNSQSVPKIKLSLNDVIRLATDSSLSAFIAENTYEARNLNYLNFTAQKRPFISLNAEPINFNRSVSQQYNFQDSSYYYVEQQTLSSSANLRINQTITKTGGRLYLDSDLRYLKNLKKDYLGQYFSIPVRIGYSQQLFGFNSYVA